MKKTMTFYAFIVTMYLSAQNKNETEHFDKVGKAPSNFTIAKWDKLKHTLPFEDKIDFEEQKKGFISAPDYKEIMSEDSTHIAWSMGKYDFLLEGKDFQSIHPSLQRQAYLNMNYGLYEVLPGVIYQVRGFDLANISFIKSDTGWIIFDPLTSKETASAALKLVNEKLGKRPVVAVVYSHSHADHFGGVRGVIDEANVKSGEVKVIAPIGFMKAAVTENIYAGNAMSRRLFYQYGVLLHASPFGHVDQSIGKNVSAGNLGLIEPNIFITKNTEELTIDGVKMIFQNTPGTEAPAEMNTYFPELKAFWAAENITGTIHNIYTLRGAIVRDALEWSKKIDEALHLFGQDAQVMFASHSWPRWGNERIQEVMKGQRDTYANLNNGVLNLANKGVSINEVHNVYEVPKSLQKQWYARSYHGSVEHNSRAVINRYLGYWDANPATLIPLSPKISAPLYVEMMGGSKKIITKGKVLYAEGNYLYAVEILNKLVFAEPTNKEARALLADCYEQIGYQQESPSLRNSFLAGAYELRNGIPAGFSPHGSGPDLIRAMTVGLFLDFIGIRVNSKKAEGMQFTMNIILPDIKEKYIAEMSNATFTNLEGFEDPNATLTIIINRSDLNQVMMGQKTLKELIASGVAKTKGDLSVLTKLASTLDTFEIGFEILPGTAGKTIEKNNKKTFQQEEPFIIGTE